MRSLFIALSQRRWPGFKYFFGSPPRCVAQVDDFGHYLRGMRNLLIHGLVMLSVHTGVHRVSSQSVIVEPLVSGEVLSFHSTRLDQPRKLNVQLPAGYSPDSAARYPVVYVLDGSAHEDFPHIAGLVQFMNMYDLYPKSIVVGIANVDRYHDFTHSTKGDSDLVWLPTGGGSAAFIEFIAEEVLPTIDRRYKTDGKRTIVGQSLGGLLGLQLLVERPELFDDYVLVSPSLWWDNASLAARAVAFAKSRPTSPERVFIAMAKDDTPMRKPVASVIAAFERHTRAPFKWRYMDFPKETHATILHRAAYSGFEFLSGTAK